MSKLRNGFTLIELLLAIVLFLTLISVAVYNFSTLSDSANYKEAKERLKTYLISQKYKAAYDQKQIELVETNLNSFTNDLNILETSTRIIFFSDGSVQESYIVVSSIDGNYTNKIVINVIGYVFEQSDIEPIESKDRLPIEYEDIKVD